MDSFKQHCIIIILNDRKTNTLEQAQTPTGKVTQESCNL